MKSADELRVAALCCTGCDCQYAWVETYEHEKQPTSCLSCGAPLAILTGEPAANICFCEAAEWASCAEVTARSAANQIRYSEALKIHGIAEKKKADKPCA